MSNLKDYVKYVAKMIVRNISRVFFLFPIKEGRVLFSAFFGNKVADNPRCIYDFLKVKYPNICEYVWVYNGNRDNIDLPVDVRTVKRFSFRWFYNMATANVIVDNYPPSSLVPRRKRQLYIETWHAGGAYKKIGNAYDEKKESEKKATNLAMDTVNVFVSSSEGFTKGNIESGYHYKGEILKCGMPRNDVFFDERDVENRSKKVREIFSLHGVVALYAPTFRDNAKHSKEVNVTLDIDELRNALEMRYEQDVYIIVRGHDLDQHHFYFDGEVIDAGDYPDMQELLCASDILITDYSSSIWDYALLGRPCLLFTPDLEKYVSERGFFTPIEQWPGIICKSMEELRNVIVNFDEEACAEKARNHLAFMGSYENGHATEIISDRIIGHINGE